jgi:hypothetical protein
LSPVQKSHHGKDLAVAFITIYKQQFTLSHYCEISSLPNAALAAQTLGWMIQQFPLT